jgi:hypothetical protein
LNVWNAWIAIPAISIHFYTNILEEIFNQKLILFDWRQVKSSLLLKGKNVNKLLICLTGLKIPQLLPSYQHIEVHPTNHITNSCDQTGQKVKRPLVFSTFLIFKMWIPAIYFPLQKIIWTQWCWKATGYFLATFSS